MMSTVFRIATEQAIREIVEEHSTGGRFGLIVTEENMVEISKKVVDLFEMTLELRSKTQSIFGLGASSAQSFAEKEEEERAPFPKSRNASEIYAFEERSKSQNATEVSLMPNLDVKLPRKRFELSLEEKERMTRR